jgi:hypothetical protein
MFDVLKHATRASLRFGPMNRADLRENVPAGRTRGIVGLPEPRTPGVAGPTRAAGTGLQVPADIHSALALTDQTLALVEGALQRACGAIHLRNIAMATREMAEAMAACRSLAVVTGLVLRAVPVPLGVSTQADRMFRHLSMVADTLSLACRRDDWERVEGIVGTELPAVLDEWTALAGVVRDAVAVAQEDAGAGSSEQPPHVFGVAAGVH